MAKEKKLVPASFECLCTGFFSLLVTVATVVHMSFNYQNSLVPLLGLGNIIHAMGLAGAASFALNVSLLFLATLVLVMFRGFGGRLVAFLIALALLVSAGFYLADRFWVEFGPAGVLAMTRNTVLWCNSLLLMVNSFLALVVSILAYFRCRKRET